MAFKIGFAAEQPQTKTESTYIAPQRTIAPRKSVVQVRFPDRGTTLAYYNDQFDLHCGDIVFVDGNIVCNHILERQHPLNVQIASTCYKIFCVGIFARELIADQVTTIIQILPIHIIVFYSMPTCWFNTSDRASLFGRH